MNRTRSLLAKSLIVALMLLFTYYHQQDCLADDNVPTVVFVAPGSPMQAMARENMSSESNQLGDTVLMQLSAPVFSGADLALPIGLLLEGEISDIHKAGKNGKPGFLDITIINIITHSGTRIPMRAKLNHDRLNLSKQKAGSGKAFEIKKGTKIPFLVAQTLRFEYSIPLHRMVPNEDTNIKAGFSSKKKDQDFIPFFDPSQLSPRRNAFEDPGAIYDREQNHNPYF